MSRTLNRLTALQVTSPKQPGRHADGGGLYLRVTDAGSRSWVFMVTREGKRVEIGLGAVSSVSLKVARELAARVREAIALGNDPRSALVVAAEVVPPDVPTFGGFADGFIASIEQGWKSEVHRQQWRSSLRDHAQALNDAPIDTVDTEQVLAVLMPIWLEKPETARRLRGRIERILDAAKVRGHRSRESTNPAAWRGHLALLMPSQNRLSRGHHKALPRAGAVEFMKRLRERPAISARCLEFVILTAARSGEALGATWGEIDLDNMLWKVPGSRMKAGREHVVPLSSAAVAVLRKVRPDKPGPEHKVFAVAGAARSNMAMTMLLRRMDYGHVTTHGFRSMFRDWAGEATDFSREVIEHALAHSLPSKVEAAYRRETALPKRRKLMDAWADFLNGDPKPEVELSSAT